MVLVYIHTVMYMHALCVILVCKPEHSWPFHARSTLALMLVGALASYSRAGLLMIERLAYVFDDAFINCHRR